MWDSRRNVALTFMVHPQQQTFVFKPLILIDNVLPDHCSYSFILIAGAATVIAVMYSLADRKSIYKKGESTQKVQTFTKDRVSFRLNCHKILKSDPSLKLSAL